MNKSKIVPIDYRLEPAHLNWLDVRTQMVIGMILLFCLCLVNFLAVGRLSAADNVIFSLPCSLSSCFFLCLRMADFVLYYGSCLLTALMALEITGRFGNRCGAGCAIWAALIFCVIPEQYFFCLPCARAFRVAGFFILLLAFWCVSSIKNKVWIMSLLGATFSFEIFLDQSYSKNFFSGFSWLLFATGSHSRVEVSSIMLAAVYIVAILIFLTRLFLGTLSYKAFESIVLCLFIAIAAANFQIFEYFICPWSVVLDSSIRSLLGPAALAIAISLCCLPTIDHVRVGVNRIIGVVGVIALIVLTINLESLFTSWERTPPSAHIFQF